MKQAAKYRAEAEKTAKKYRTLQDEIAQADKKTGAKKQLQPMQAGARKYPVSPRIAAMLRGVNSKVKSQNSKN